VGDGTLARVAKVGSPVTLPPVVADKTLFLLADSGEITAWR
jgi:hypothetical protein